MALKWFKMYPQIWESGRISIETDEVQGCFLRCCLLLFQRECDLDEEFLRAKIRNDKAIDRLIHKGFIRLEDDQVIIDWICDEVAGAVSRSARATQNAKAMWSKTSTKSQDNGTANKKENKRKEKKFVIPTEDAVIEYFDSNKRSKADARNFYHYYNSQDWIKSNGIAIKSWKSQAQTWFKKNNDFTNGSTSKNLNILK